MAPTLSLLAPSRTSGAALPAVPGLRRPMVLHRVLVSVDMNANVSGVRIDASYHQHSVTQRGQSNRLVTIVPGFLDRVRIGATNRPITPLPRPIRAVVSASEVVTESERPPSALASKAKATVVRPWFTRQPDDLELATTGALTTVGSDGLIEYRRFLRSAERIAIGLTPTTQLIPLPGAVLVSSRNASTCTPNLFRLFDGNIIAPERISESTMQRASEPHLIADHLDNIIPFIRRKFAEGGIDQEEQDHLDDLIECSDRALRYAEIIDLTTSLTRVGPNKRNARRLRELFPELGPGIA